MQVNNQTLKRALVIVDVQNDFCKGGSLEVPKAQEIFPVVNKLIDLPIFDLTILTRDWHSENHCSFQTNNPGSKLFETIVLKDTGEDQVMWPKHCVQGSHGAEFHSDLKLSGEEFVVSKGTLDRVESYSGFGNFPEQTNLDSLLRHYYINEVYVVGLAYDYCVGSTAEDAAKLGYKTFVVMDGTRSVNQESAKQMQKRLEKQGVHEILSNDVFGQQ